MGYPHGIGLKTVNLLLFFQTYYHVATSITIADRDSKEQDAKGKHKNNKRNINYSNKIVIVLQSLLSSI